MLHEQRLLDHCLIWLGKEVVFLDIVEAAWRANLSQVPLQVILFDDFLLLLWLRLDLLVISPR